MDGHKDQASAHDTVDLSIAAFQKGRTVPALPAALALSCCGLFALQLIVAKDFSGDAPATGTAATSAIRDCKRKWQTVRS